MCDLGDGIALSVCHMPGNHQVLRRPFLSGRKSLSHEQAVLTIAIDGDTNTASIYITICPV